jgi:hypothetical protein
MEGVTLGEIVQLVSSGGVAALGYYLVIIAMPKMQDKHDVTIRDLQNVFMTELRAMQKVFSEHNDKKDALFRDAMNQMTNELIRALKGHADARK